MDDRSGGHPLAVEFVQFFEMLEVVLKAEPHQLPVLRQGTTY
jgi:hypothetical protein